MIKYEILELDVANSKMSVKYTRDEGEEYITDVPLPPSMEFNEVAIHHNARNYSRDAVDYWDNRIALQDFELKESIGYIKRTVFDDHPEFNRFNETVVEEIEETEDTIYHRYKVVEINKEQLATNIRSQRDMLLFNTDMLVVADRNPSPEILEYRQKLRDITKQEGFPQSVVFPTLPE